MGDRRRETGAGGHENGDRRSETGAGRHENGDRRSKTGDRDMRSETGERDRRREMTDFFGVFFLIDLKVVKRFIFFSPENVADRIKHNNFYVTI